MRLTTTPMRTLCLAACAAWLGCAPMPAAAQPYPNKPIRIIVPFSPGGGNDVIARLLAVKLAPRLGQPVLVENRPGAGGNIGIGVVAKSPADGYTVLTVTNSLMINPSLYPSTPYDPVKDFEPVMIMASSPNVLVVHPSVQAKTVQELIAVIKAAAGKFSMASAGTGTTSQLSIELFKQTLGLNFINIPYNGSAPSTQSVVAGQTNAAILVLPTTTGHVRAGQLRALAVTADKRSPALPDVPTMAEAGVPGQETETIQGMLLPAGTPPAIVARLHDEVKSVLDEPEVRQIIGKQGFEVVAGTQEDFRADIKAEYARWAKVIKAGNIKVE
ncbi:MAG TPA: tripartite tricarboxylate transporter substrate binding protein [Burkholderiales bacterium]|nr:tripartite tricarboxylate transporter substrate binding protein [Burkholderiales bacterium]